jgi:hypothetical protein
MLGVVYYVVREAHAGPIHWEAVLLTAVPATIAAVAAVATGIVGRRTKQHVAAIDNAVNGIEPGHPTLREKVEAIADATPGAGNGGQAPGAPS